MNAADALHEPAEVLIGEALPHKLTAEPGEKWNYQERKMYLGEVYHRLSNYRKPPLEENNTEQQNRSNIFVEIVIES